MVIGSFVHVVSSNVFKSVMSGLPVGLSARKKKPQTSHSYQFSTKVYDRLISLLGSASRLIGLLASCFVSKSAFHFFNAGSFRNLGYLGHLESLKLCNHPFHNQPLQKFRLFRMFRNTPLRCGHPSMPLSPTCLHANGQDWRSIRWFD